MPSNTFALPRHTSARRHRLRRFTTIAVFGAVLTVAGCGSPEAKPGSTTADAGAAITRLAPGDRKPAPELAGDDLAGNPISLSEMKGKVVVVNIWGSWCPPCRKEQPVLSQVSIDLKPQGVEFLGIAVRENAATSKAYADAKRVPYPSISDSGGKLLIGFASSLPAIAIPTTYIIDKQGRVATRLLDVATQSTLTSLVTEIVEEP